MKRNLKLLLPDALWGAGGLAVYAGILLLLAHSPLSGLALSCIEAHPLVMLIYVAFLSCTALTIHCRNALSMGSTRRELFGAFQVFALVSVVLLWVVQLGLDTLVPVLGLNPEQLDVLPSRNLSLYLMYLAVFFLAALIQELILRHRVLGFLVTLFCFLAVEVFMGVFLYVPALDAGGLWGDLPLLLPLCTGAVILVLDLIYFLVLSRMTVR